MHQPLRRRVAPPLRSHLTAVGARRIARTPHRTSRSWALARWSRPLCPCSTAVSVRPLRTPHGTRRSTLYCVTG